MLNLRSNANCRDFTVTSHSHAIFKNPAPHRGRSNGHEFEAHWTTVDKDLLKMEKYTLIHGLSMNFFFGFNDAQFVRKLVQAVRVFQTSSPGLLWPRATVRNFAVAIMAEVPRPAASER